MTLNTATIIEPGTPEYDTARIFVQTFAAFHRFGAVYAVTTAELAKDHEHAQYGHVDPPTALLYVDGDGVLHPAKVVTNSGPWGEDDYATVRGEVRDTESGIVVARFTYTLDGRA